MSTHTEVQIIRGLDGAPAFVVVPYSDWLSQRDRDKALVPNEVVNLIFDHDMAPMRAWREHLGLTQAEVAGRIGISQAAYAQMENTANPRRPTLKKIAMALGLSVEQLDF